jgi:organic radical activating enzyme
LWSGEDRSAATADILSQATTKYVNLCGGNPLLNSETPEILQRLKKRNHFVTVTTNGHRFDQIDPQLLRYIDIPIIYLPGANRNDLLEISGFDCLRYYENTFGFLKDNKKKAIIHFPVTNATIEQLPDLADYCTRDNRLFLWVSYRQSSANKLSKAEKNALHYYQTRKRSFTYLSNEIPSNLCNGCFHELENLRLKNILFFTHLFSKMYF